MATGIVNPGSLPLLGTITNLWRAKVNDQEAEILQDGEPTLLVPILMSAIRDTYRELRNVGDPTLITDNYVLTGLPPLNSPTLGLAMADPTVQMELTITGLFDGVSQNSGFVLPGDCIRVTEVWERLSGTNGAFAKVEQARHGIPPELQSAYSIGRWEWRGNALFFSGSLQSMDIRLRYQSGFTEFFSTTTDYTMTSVGLPDSADAIAAKCVLKYDLLQAGPGSEAVVAAARDEDKFQMFELKNAIVRTKQGINYRRNPYGGGNSGYRGQ